MSLNPIGICGTEIFQHAIELIPGNISNRKAFLFVQQKVNQEFRVLDCID